MNTDAHFPKRRMYFGSRTCKNSTGRVASLCLAAISTQRLINESCHDMFARLAEWNPLPPLPTPKDNAAMEADPLKRNATWVSD